MKRALSGLVLLAAAASSGCSGASEASNGSSCQTASDGAKGSGTVSGTLHGMAFGAVSSSLWIGQPDSAETTVIYLFSQPVACSALCSPGWDARIGDGITVLELKALGVAPATFPVVKTATPATGEAVVNATLSSTSATPSETSGSGGTLSLAQLRAKQMATGTFDLPFASENLSGSFNAAYCPEGHEP